MKLMRFKYLLTSLLLVLPLEAAAQTADEIVKKVIDARGGLEKIKSVQSQRISGYISFSKDTRGTFSVELKRPLKMRAEISVEGQQLIRVYDGKSSGWTINPFLGSREVEPLPAGDLKNISDESDFDGPLVDYKSKGNQIELVGKEALDDKPVYRLKLTNKNGDVRFYIFDAASFLLVKWEGNRKNGEENIPWESYFSDYRDVKGLKYSFRIDQGSPGTEIRQTLFAEKIEVDLPIDDSRFGKPSLTDSKAPKP